MGDEPRFNEKWDFRRKEQNFDDSSSEEPDSKSIRDPIIHNPNLVLNSNQLGNGTETVTRDQPVKTRKRRSKKDDSKPEKAKQVRRRKPKTVCVEESKKQEEKAAGTDEVGMFMKTLIDDLTASRERLMDWMNTELYESSDQNVASQPPLKKKAVAVQRSMKTKRAKKKEDEEKESEKQSKPNEKGPDMNKSKEKSPEIVQNGGDLDCNAGSLDRFLKSGQSDFGRNYFQEQHEDQAVIVAQPEMEDPRNKTLKIPQNVVLAIEAQTSSQRQKKTCEANTIKNRSAVGSERQIDHNFVIPFALEPSSSPSLQSFPVASSLSSVYPSSSQGITSLASNNNFQFRQPQVVTQVPDLSEYQIGYTGGQGYGNSPFHSNGYFSGFPAAFQPNLIASGYNFPAQVNPATSSQQRDNSNMFGSLRMTGGAIRLAGNRFPEAEVGSGNNNPSDYRTSSGR